MGFSENSGGVPQLRLFDAKVIDWNVGTGNYGAASSWQPNNVPDNSPAAETARFNTGSSHTVLFSASHSVQDLLAEDTSVVFEPSNSATANPVYTINDQVDISGGQLLTSNAGAAFDMQLEVAGETHIGDSGILAITPGAYTANRPITMASSATLRLQGNNASVTANAGLDNSVGGTIDHGDGELTIRGGAFQPNTGGASDDYLIDGPTAVELPHLAVGAGATANIGRNIRVGN